MMLGLVCGMAWAGGLVPGPVQDAPALAVAWAPDGAWRTSEVRYEPDGGIRVGALVTAPLAAPLVLEARGVGADGSVGPWIGVEETWRDDVSRVLVADLDDRWAGAQVRARGLPGLDTLAWELLTPVDEPAADAPPPPPSPLSAGLQDLGVVSRSSWGARATTCTSLEDDWYRFAIHHTAGSQTSGGTVEGAVRALQAYSMDSGSYCDIPYQFLVGYDGSLWEGRPLTYLSGATGGGNNPGNIAVSFLGCYTPSGCPGSSHAAPDAMLAWARLLVQTLADDHGIVTDESWLRGHRDWPGNSTVCPGEYVYARLDELRSGSARFEAEVEAASFPIGGEIEVPVGVPVELWVDVRNVGTDAWSPAATRLAPLPRDVASDVAGADWLSDTRVGGVPVAVDPGGLVRLTFTVEVAAPGPHPLSLGLVEEGVAWFEDRPYGGGFAAGALTLDLVGVEGEGDTALPGDSADPDVGGTGGGGGSAWTDPPGSVQTFAEPPPPAQGCGCGGAPMAGALGGWIALLGLAARRRRGGAAAPRRPTPHALPWRPSSPEPGARPA